MNPGMRSILLGGALVLGLAAAGRAQGSAEDRIQALLEQALAAQTEKDAEQKIRQAEEALRGAALSPLGRAFAETDIERTRGQVRVRLWRRDPAQTALRDAGRKYLLAARARYERLVKQADDTAAAIEQKSNTLELDKNRDYQEARGSILRAQYWMAKTDYTLALSYEEADGERGTHLKEAVKGFTNFTANGYKPKPPVVVDCFLSQAWCLYHQKHYFEVGELLKEATSANTPPATYRDMTQLRVMALHALPSPLQAESAAAEYFRGVPAGRRLDGVELEIVLERLRCLAELADPKANPEYAQGYKAQRDAVKAMIASYGDPWSTEAAKVVGERPPPSAASIVGAATKLYNEKKYVEALKEAEASLKPLAGQTGPAVFTLQYVKVASLWHLNRWRETHLAAFDYIQMGPKEAESPKVCRLALQAGIKALREQPPLGTAEFDRFLAFAQGHFPEDAEVQKEVQGAPWHRAESLLAAKQYAEAEQALQAIGPKSPVYLRAQYGLALAAYKQAEGLKQAGKPDPAVLAGHLKRAIDAVERFIGAARNSVPEAERPAAQEVVNIAVASAHLMLDLPDPAPRTAATVLDRLESWPAIGDQAAEQRRALKIAITLRSGRLDEVMRQVDSTLEKARPDDAAAARALTSAADPLEKQAERLRAESDRTAARKVDEQLLRIYEFLYAHAQHSTDSAVRDQEVTIRRRTAHVLLRLDRPADAIPHYEFALQKVPREKSGDVLRGLAIADEKLQRFDKALEPWRVLSGGLKKDADDWFEARYHLILCYWKTGQADHARKLMADFRLRYPKGAPDAFKDPFEALHEEMEKGAGAKPLAGTPRA